MENVLSKPNSNICLIFGQKVLGTIVHLNNIETLQKNIRKRFNLCLDKLVIEPQSKIERELVNSLSNGMSFQSFATMAAQAGIPDERIAKHIEWYGVNRLMALCHKEKEFAARLSMLSEHSKLQAFPVSGSARTLYHCYVPLEKHNNQELTSEVVSAVPMIVSSLFYLPGFPSWKNKSQFPFVSTNRLQKAPLIEVPALALHPNTKRALKKHKSGNWKQTLGHFLLLALLMKAKSSFSASTNLPFASTSSLSNFSFYGPSPGVTPLSDAQVKLYYQRRALMSALRPYLDLIFTLLANLIQSFIILKIWSWITKPKQPNSTVQKFEPALNSENKKVPLSVILYNRGEEPYTLNPGESLEICCAS